MSTTQLTLSLAEDLDHLGVDGLAVWREVAARVAESDEDALSAWLLSAESLAELTLNSNAHASSSLFSATSHSSGSSSSASRSVEVSGRSLSTSRWSAVRIKSGEKTA
jgi:hypothetical protein